MEYGYWKILICILCFRFVWILRPAYNKSFSTYNQLTHTYIYTDKAPTSLNAKQYATYNMDSPNVIRE